ncbi:hypothetical protein RFI_28852, partial [Reticulomyxa filosa]
IKKVRTVGQTTVVALRDERRDYPFFLIHNQTNYLLIYQEIGSNHLHKVSARTAQPFAWENHFVPKNEKQILIKVGEINFEKPIEFEKATNYLGCVRMSPKSVTYLYLRHRGATKVILATERPNKEEESDNAQTTVALEINRLGISLVNQMPLELIYAWADQINFQTVWSRNEQIVNLKMNSFQVDNQLPKAPSPILFCGTPHTRGNYLLLIYLLASFLYSFCVFMIFSHMFISALCATKKKKKKKKYINNNVGHVHFFDVLGGGSTVSETTVQSQLCAKKVPIYFGQLYLGPLDMYISYHQLSGDFVANMFHCKGPAHLSDSTAGYLMVEDEKEDASSSSVQKFLYQFGVVVLNIPEARIPVSGYMCEDRVFDQPMLENVLAAHYKGQVDIASLSLLLYCFCSINPFFDWLSNNK